MLGKGKAHLGHTLNSLTPPLETVWGFGAPLSVSDSMTISKRIWAHRRALVGKVAEHMGQLKFFVFFYIWRVEGEGKEFVMGKGVSVSGGLVVGWEEEVVGDDGTVGGGESRKESASSSPSRVSRKEEGE